MNPKKQNAVNALLDEYRKAVHELQSVIVNLQNDNLSKIVDPLTENPDCKSIQTILAHVVSSGYSYCVYIRNLKDPSAQRPLRINRETAQEYCNDLDAVLHYTDDTFAQIFDVELEVFESDKKMHTSWQQEYDIEQLMEHAIVHILRHRRQIERFKTMLHESN
ncbi:MAG: DinB family protein [Aequorivita antarctica]